MKKLMIKVGEYVKDGQTKGKYVEAGIIMSGDKGEFALLNPSVNLAGCLMQQRILNQGKQAKGKGDMVMCSIFDNDKEAKPQAQQAPVDFDDDIPFK